ncbi:MAG: hypothetical protein WCC94_07090 [Candidatus Bathyarchaeia archaeon]
MKLLQVSQEFEVALEALGRKGCPEICLAIMSPQGDEWKNFSDVYYELVSQTRLPYATYSKLTNFLIDKGFIEKNTATIKNRKTILVRLTERGKELLKMYLTLQGWKLEDLEPGQASSYTSAVELGRDR